MRITEFEHPMPQNAEGTLITILQFALTKAGMSDKWADKDVRVSTNTILKLLNNSGIGFSFQDLDALIKSSPNVKNRVASINKDIMIIRTNSPKPNDDMATSPEGDQTVSNMADRASKRAEKEL